MIISIFLHNKFKFDVCKRRWIESFWCLMRICFKLRGWNDGKGDRNTWRLDWAAHVIRVMFHTYLQMIGIFDILSICSRSKLTAKEYLFCGSFDNLFALHTKWRVLDLLLLLSANVVLDTSHVELHLVLVWLRSPSKDIVGSINVANNWERSSKFFTGIFVFIVAF